MPGITFQKETVKELRQKLQEAAAIIADALGEVCLVQRIAVL